MTEKTTEKLTTGTLSQHNGNLPIEMREFNSFNPREKVILTLGVQALVDTCSANWVVDLVISYTQGHKIMLKKTFSTFEFLKTSEDSLTVKIAYSDDETGETVRVAEQRIRFTDLWENFKLPVDKSFKIWAIRDKLENNKAIQTILLPSEY